MPRQTSASVNARVSNLAHLAYSKLQHSFFVVSGGIQNMSTGKVHSLATDMAILLVHCALKTKLEDCVKKRPWTLDAPLQQRFVLASVQAFTKCLAAPGGLQHTGKHP